MHQGLPTTHAGTQLLASPHRRAHGLACLGGRPLSPTGNSGLAHTGTSPTLGLPSGRTLPKSAILVSV